jgi:hypothetical protein
MLNLMGFPGTRIVSVSHQILTSIQIRTIALLARMERLGTVIARSVRSLAAGTSTLSTISIVRIATIAVRPAREPERISVRAAKRMRIWEQTLGHVPARTPRSTSTQAQEPVSPARETGYGKSRPNNASFAAPPEHLRMEILVMLVLGHATLVLSQQPNAPPAKLSARGFRTTPVTVLRHLFV